MRGTLIEGVADDPGTGIEAKSDAQLALQMGHIEAIISGNEEQGHDEGGDAKFDSAIGTQNTEVPASARNDDGVREDDEAENEEDGTCQFPDSGVTGQDAARDFDHREPTGTDNHELGAPGDVEVLHALAAPMMRSPSARNALEQGGKDIEAESGVPAKEVAAEEIAK